MVPDSLATLYALLALVTPGLVYVLVSERARPSRGESAFREASLVAVTSLIFTTLSVLILAGLSRLWPGNLVDLAGWLAQGDEYAAANLRLVAWSVGIEALLAVLLAGGSALGLSRLQVGGASPVAKTSVWWQALQGDTPKDKASWVKAELTDGTHIWGYVHYFSIQDLGGDRDISFKGPGLTIQRGVGRPVRETYYEYFIVSASQIRILKVGHEPRKVT